MFCRNDTRFVQIYKRHRDRLRKLIFQTNCELKSARHDDVFGFTGLNILDTGRDWKMRFMCDGFHSCSLF